jgi:hypothetical protein
VGVALFSGEKFAWRARSAHSSASTAASRSVAAFAHALDSAARAA